MNPFVESVPRSQSLLELKPWEPPVDAPLPRKTKREEMRPTPVTTPPRGPQVCSMALRRARTF